MIADVVQSIDARSGEVVGDVAEETSATGLDEICGRAAAVSHELDQLGRSGRAAMLNSMADALEHRRWDIVSLADRETALGTARLDAELTRTCFQLRFFAEVVTDGAYLEATIDHAGDTPMGPRPDLRRMLRPLGPVAVFGASNFPLAFSVPGGDTASALAAGCPVVVKVHEAHPATSVLCAEALADGALPAGLTSPVVFLVFGETAGASLVSHPTVQAVGFTGSLKGGRRLHDVAASRPSPIPFYGEMGALNAVVVGPVAALRRTKEIATGLAGSFSLGVGQFCTKPGVAILPEGSAGDALRKALADDVLAMPAGRMLTERAARGFAERSAALRGLDGVDLVAKGQDAGDGTGFWAVPLLLEADAAAFDGPLREECFGPVLVIVRYRGRAELRDLLGRLSPALTASIHADDEEAELFGPALEQLSAKSGRLVWNGYPTGVAVAWAMHHGGPYPASTDPLHTSVGATAVRRWLRPVTYQDLPESLLPQELRDEPGAGRSVPRRVDGRLVLPEGPAGP
jgi:NADP-dependent aldehyde dehydrogenase